MSLALREDKTVRLTVVVVGVGVTLDVSQGQDTVTIQVRDDDAVHTQMDFARTVVGQVAVLKREVDISVALRLAVERDEQRRAVDVSRLSSVDGRCATGAGNSAGTEEDGECTECGGDVLVEHCDWEISRGKHGRERIVGREQSRMKGLNLG